MEAADQDDISLPESIWEDLFSDLGLDQPLPIQADAEQDRIENEEMIDDAAEDANTANEEMIVEEAEDTDSADEVVTETGSENASAANVDFIKVDTEATINVNESGEIGASTSKAAASMCSDDDVEARLKLKHIRDRFVDDLIQAVKHIKIELKVQYAEIGHLRDDTHTPYTCYFSVAHKYTIWKYIRSQKENFNTIINNHTRKSCNCHIFENCKKRFIEVYKPEVYSEVGFVNFCAAIAYLGIQCSDSSLDHNAEIKSKGYIGLLLWEVLRRGDLHTSSW